MWVRCHVRMTMKCMALGWGNCHLLRPWVLAGERGALRDGDQEPALPSGAAVKEESGENVRPAPDRGAAFGARGQKATKGVNAARSQDGRDH